MKIAIGNPGVGDQLLPFELPTTTDKSLNPGAFSGRWTVLLFYPSEQVPTCMATLDAIREAHEQFMSRKMDVYGISLSPPDMQKTFANEHQLPFPLASDSQLQVSAAHGALRPKEGTPLSGETDKLQLTA